MKKIDIDTNNETEKNWLLNFFSNLLTVTQLL